MRFYNKQHPVSIAGSTFTREPCTSSSSTRPAKSSSLSLLTETTLSWLWSAFSPGTGSLTSAPRKRSPSSSQCNLPDFGGRIKYKAHRESIVERFADPSVRKSIDTDLTLLGHDDGLISDLELHIVRTVKVHDADTFHRLCSIPGVGKILAMTILYEIHSVARFPRVQEFCSYSRLVKCSRESAGKRHGFGGSKIGNVHLKWAFSEAAVSVLSKSDEARKLVERLRRKHGKAKALSILAHKLGRAVYYMMTREKTFNMQRFASC